MLVIRLRRVGRHKDPHYRIVVAEHTSPVQGKFVAEIGHYHPKSKECVINQPALLDWMNKGAKPSNTVARLAQKAKIAHKHVVVKQFSGKPRKKASDATALPTDTAPIAPSDTAVDQEPTSVADATESPQADLEEAGSEPINAQNDADETLAPEEKNGN